MMLIGRHFFILLGPRLTHKRWQQYHLEKMIFRTTLIALALLASLTSFGQPLTRLLLPTKVISHGGTLDD